MKLYLSSYRIGHEPQRLRRTVVGPNIAVIRNSLDFSDDHDRLELGRQKEFADLQELGFSPVGLDLRDYFGKKSELLAKLRSLDGVWVVGGNAFILRRAMNHSGMDDILRGDDLPTDFTYAGYSAGICVLSPSLRGIDIVDPPDVIPKGYDRDIIWDGLGLVPHSFAPHYKSDHPESGLIDDVVLFFEANNIEYLPLRDGEVFVTEKGV